MIRTVFSSYSTKRFAQCSWLLLAVLLFAGVASLPAQQITGAIAGTVKDSTGAVIANADVKATNVNTGFIRGAVTDDSGNYIIQYLPVGTYSVEVTAPSFKNFMQQNMVITVDQTQALTWCWRSALPARR